MCWTAVTSVTVVTVTNVHPSILQGVTFAALFATRGCITVVSPQTGFSKKKVGNPHVCTCQIFDTQVSAILTFLGGLTKKSTVFNLAIRTDDAFVATFCVLSWFVCSSYFLGGSVQLVQCSNFHSILFVERLLSLCSWTESSTPLLPSIATSGAHCK